jgi:hypothetical protein
MLTRKRVIRSYTGPAHSWLENQMSTLSGHVTAAGGAFTGAVGTHVDPRLRGAGKYIGNMGSSMGSSMGSWLGRK